MRSRWDDRAAPIDDDLALRAYTSKLIGNLAIVFLRPNVAPSHADCRVGIPEHGSAHKVFTTPCHTGVFQLN